MKYQVKKQKLSWFARFRYTHAVVNDEGTIYCVSTKPGAASVARLMNKARRIIDSGGVAKEDK